MLDVASRPWIPGAWYTLVQLQVGRWMLRICCSPEALLRFDPHFQFWGPVLGLKCSVFSHHLMGGCHNPLWVPGHSGSLHDLGHTKPFLTVLIVWICISSVAQSCPTLCDLMNHSTPGLPVHHQLLEFTQIHAHWVGDAIQPSHPLSSPSPPALNLSQHQILLKWVSFLHQVAKVLEF